MLKNELDLHCGKANMQNPRYSDSGSTGLSFLGDTSNIGSLLFVFSHQGKSRQAQPLSL
jgi:hypothetical protein